METKDHLTLGKMCLKGKREELSFSARLAFLFGNIEPDINPLTYLKKNKGRLDFKGHHFPNAEHSIRKLAAKLTGQRHFCLYDYFRLGVLMHYTADAFTFAHNRRFGSSLAEHGRYEAKLHQCFVNAGMSTDLPVPDRGRPEDISAEIFQMHEEYEEAGCSEVERDYGFIRKAAAMLLGLVPQESPAYRRLQQKKRVMELTGREAA